MNPVGLLRLVVLLTCFTTTTITNIERYDYIDVPTRITTEYEYSKIFRRRRIAHSGMIEDLKKRQGTYYFFGKVHLGFHNIYSAMRQSKRDLDDLQYKPEQGFSMYYPKQKPLVLLLEATSMIADRFFYFPQISFQILTHRPKWTETIMWCLKFVEHFHVTDENTKERLSLIYMLISYEFKDQDN